MNGFSAFPWSLAIGRGLTPLRLILLGSAWLSSNGFALALLPLWTLVGDWIWWVNGVTMTIAVILTIASGIDYVVSEVRGARSRRQGSAR